MMLTKEELNKQLQDIISFLSIVHPTLADGSDTSSAVEIRPICRSEYNYVLAKPLNIWKFDDKSNEFLYKFLEKHNGAGYCLYYSVFTYNYEQQGYTKAKKPAQKGRITIDTAKYTQEIAIDFDDINEEDVFEYMRTLSNIGLEPLWTQSGHGYHAHILLKEKLSDRTVLAQLVYLLRSRGFMADPHCIDAARVFRLPGTYNFKGYKDNPNANFPLCKIIKKSLQRYSVVEIIDKISTLPIISGEDLKVYNSYIQNIIVPTNEADKPTIAEEESNDSTQAHVENAMSRYSMLDADSLPPAVVKMLVRTNQGLRNAVCGFLIKYFKNYYKLSRKEIYSIMEVWSKKACVPEYELNESFDRFYNMNGLCYDSSMATVYGKIDFSRVTDKSAIWIPNQLFTNFNKLSGKAVRMYLAIKTLEHLKKATDLQSIMNVLGMSHAPSARATIKELLASKFIYVENGVRKLGIENKYFTQKIINISEGQSKLSYNDIVAYVSELNGNEIKIYLHMKFKCFKTGTCFISQGHIGEAVGLKQQSISGIMKELESKSYIDIQRKQITEFLSFCNYTLLR